MKFMLLVTMLLHGRFHIHCFNIDTKFPIVYSKPNLMGRNSYFGFSLLLRKKWIQIGAPRANSSILGEKVMEPGVAYRCEIWKPCEEIILDKNKNVLRDDDVTVWDLKNHSWIGGAMAMESDDDGKVVVCGHRWKNQANLDHPGFNIETIGYAMSGICYISQFSETQFTQKFKYALPKRTHDRDVETHDDVVYHGLFHKSQIGISVYIAPPSQDSISLLIGAPGAGRYWSGGTVEYMREKMENIAARRRRQATRRDFGKYTEKGITYEFVFPKHSQVIQQFSYFGYQVAAGYFFSKDQLCHVGGSPRGADLKGLVAVYTVKNHINRDPTIVHFDVLQGQNFGEYFGSSLAVADVTGDKLDELVVGAPLFSLHGDEGCIYVYTKYSSFKNESQYRFYLKDKKIGFKIGGRFGTAVASLGDIDQDAFEDIAVSAPYEDAGVIYIYNGAPNGLSSKPSQRISASHIHSSIKGFGISISRPADIDGNKFEDVAVGSYLSEHVVLLRTSPVIELFAYVESFEKQFNMNASNFVIRACLFYKGSKNVPNNIEVVRTLDIDVKFHRFKPIPAKYLTLAKRNQFECENLTIYRKEESNNFIYDITIVLSQSLKNKENDLSHVFWVGNASRDYDKFCSSCPVVRKVHPYVISIPYARDCGRDDVCTSDAQLDCLLMQNDAALNPISGYVIGSPPNLKLTVNVHNLGEPLYSPRIIIKIPKEVELAQIPSTCEGFEGSSLSVVCSFGPIFDKETKSVSISLDLSKFETLRSLTEKGLPLTIDVMISKENYEDPDESNNYCNINMNLVMQADVNITGKSEGDVFFSKNDRKELDFLHVYEVTNVGVSPIRRVETLIQIPVELRTSGTSVQFSNPSIKAQQNEKFIFCNVAEADLKFEQIGYKGVSLDKEESENISLSDNHPSNRTLYLNCSSSDVVCRTWKCSFMEFKANTFAKITITPKLNTSKLVPIMGNRDIIYFSSNAHVEMVESFGTQSPGIETYHDISVSSAVIGTLTKEKIQLWIIILCIIVGILLIAAIVVGLAKAGFFKREKNEELQALKQSEK